jgi:hypothetical protein
MDHSAGLDVSVKETSVCIVDETGRIVREVKVASGHWQFQQVLPDVRPLMRSAACQLVTNYNHCNGCSPDNRPSKTVIYSTSIGTAILPKTPQICMN